MLLPGLVSITFRSLSAGEVIALTHRAGLSGIEWGGDVHVPHGNVALARTVAARTREAGLQVAAYGSYYRVGVSPAEGLEFEAVLETAIALNAPTIRVWAGSRGSKEMDAVQTRNIITSARKIADIAQTAGVTVSFEYHGGTLTDGLEAALRFYEAVAHPNVRSYWQPSVHESHAVRIAGLHRLLPSLSNLHVFHWLLENGGIQKQPLMDGAAEWRDYLAAASVATGPHFALIEFVRNDSPKQFLEDAEALKNWITLS